MSETPIKSVAPLPALPGVSPEALVDYLKEMEEPKFRAQQILDWVWKKKVTSFDDMLNLSLSLREKLAGAFRMSSLTHVKTQGSEDTTRKFLFRLHDGRYIESVLIPANPALYGESSDRRTLCVSSQVGCAYRCKFCASGLDGFTRNLDASEIAGQVLIAEQISGKRVDNLVFMGMGEPMANLSNLMAAIALITGPKTLHLGARHLTISTSGLAPQIRKLADHPQQIRLAISFHGATDEVRSQIMPVNKKYPVAELMNALRHWNIEKKQKLTLEYILIKGVNDSLEQAAILAKHAQDISAKVNLIPYNTVEGLEWERPALSHCRKFQDTVRQDGVTATLRLEKGHDIDAACGQLRLKQETAEGIISSPAS